MNETENEMDSQNVPGEEIPAPSEPARMEELSPPADEWQTLAVDDSYPADDSGVDHDELRIRLRAQFDRWLDEMLADESAPPLSEELLAEALADSADVDSASAGLDQYALFSALTALTGEIRLQGRTFKQLTDAVAPLAQLPDGIKDLEEAQHAAADRLEQLAADLEPDESSDAALPASKEVLGVLFDLLERLERGLATFEAGIVTLKANPPRGALARLSGARSRYDQMLSMMQCLRDGQRMTLSRLEAANQQWGIHRVGKKGDMFDPSRMTAYEVETGSSHPDGTVVEVLRGGYMFHGELLMGSHVKVAKGK